MGAAMTYYLRQIFARLDAALLRNPGLRLARFAQEIRVDRHTIEKAVHDTAGVSFREYKRHILLEEARRLIVEDFNLSEKEIAFKLGYGSRDAFCRFIKVNTGTCPSNMRRQTPP